MVCSRCKMVVKSELEALGLHLSSIELGEIDIIESISEAQKNIISERLNLLGFELINLKKSRTIEKIKTLLIDLVHNKNKTQLHKKYEKK